MKVDSMKNKIQKGPAFEVIVGNIGTVYAGTSYMSACAKYNSYVEESKKPHGRASGESVVMFHNGKPEKIYGDKGIE